MSYHEEDLALAKKYIKQGKSMKVTGLLFIVIQIVLGIAMFIWTKSFIGLLVGFALFTVVKWFVERNLAREYIVTKYVGKTVVDQYTTHGGIMGGILRMAGTLIIIVLVNALVVDYVFPVDNFVVAYIYKIGLLWVILHSVIRDVSKIKTGEQIMKEAAEPDQRDVLYRVENVFNDAKDKREKNSIRLGAAMVGVVILLLLVQTIVCWIQGPAIAKKLDMHQAYETYYEKYDGMSDHYAIPKLPEEWFAQVTEQSDAVNYGRFKTKCAVEGTGVITLNGVSQEITMELAYNYSETYGWRLNKANHIHTNIAVTGDGNITGTWYGVGRDKTMNTSDNNELTIVLNKLTTTEVSGSITCERNGETLYTKTFSGTVEESGEYLYITATYDQEDKFYPEIYFTYDVTQDMIYNIDISRDTKLSRVNP